MHVARRSTLLLLIGFILIACNTQSAVSDNSTIEYRSTKFNFRLSYPTQWQMLEDAPPMVGDNPIYLHAVTFQPPSDSKSLIVVYIQTLTATQTLDEYANQQVISLRDNETGAKFSDPAPAQLSGLDARATSAADDKSQLRRMLMVISNSKAYALILFGPTNADLSTKFETLVQSFRFLP